MPLEVASPTAVEAVRSKNQTLLMSIEHSFIGLHGALWPSVKSLEYQLRKKWMLYTTNLRLGVRSWKQPSDETAEFSGQHKQDIRPCGQTPPKES